MQCYKCGKYIDLNKDKHEHDYIGELWCKECIEKEVKTNEPSLNDILIEHAEQVNTINGSNNSPNIKIMMLKAEKSSFNNIIDNIIKDLKIQKN